MIKSRGSEVNPTALPIQLTNKEQCMIPFIELIHNEHDLLLEPFKFLLVQLG